MGLLNFYIQYTEREIIGSYYVFCCFCRDAAIQWRIVIGGHNNSMDVLRFEPTRWEQSCGNRTSLIPGFYQTFWLDWDRNSIRYAVIIQLCAHTPWTGRGAGWGISSHYNAECMREFENNHCFHKLVSSE